MTINYIANSIFKGDLYDIILLCCSLPITADVLEEILKARGWNFVSFNLQNSESAKELERLGVLEYAQKFKCFSYKQHGYKIVFYKQGMSSKENNRYYGGGNYTMCRCMCDNL